MNNIDLSIASMLLGFLLLLPPLLLGHWLRLSLSREILYGSLRMTLQLVLVGLYLEFLFQLNQPWLNGLWLLLMMLAASWSAVGRAGLPRRALLLPAMVGIGVGAFSVLLFLLLAVIRPSPLFDARFMIPLAGMLLGNSLNANYLVLERFYQELSRQQSLWLMDLSLGATPLEAARPHLRTALTAAWSPTVLSMATMGLVALPGMMTGQILGGNSPLVAIKYQLLIMIAILATASLSTTISLLASLRWTLTPFAILKDEVRQSLRR